MRRLVPETLGKSIFRRYHRNTFPGLLERRAPQPGYAGLNRPLVWHTAQRAPEPGGLSFLRRRQRPVSSEDTLTGGTGEPQELPETFDQEQAAPPEAADRPLTIQRKIVPPARRTAVEMPKSQPREKEPEAGKAETTPVQAQAGQPAAAPQTTPKSAAAPAPEGDMSPSQAEATGFKAEPRSIAKPVRQIQPENPAEAHPGDAHPGEAHQGESAHTAARQTEAARVENTAPGAKPWKPQETTPDAPTLISRKRGDAPALPQISRKAESGPAAGKDSAKPAPGQKPSQEAETSRQTAEIKPQAAENKPALVNKEIRKTSALPNVQQDFATPRNVQRKPEDEKQARPTPPAKPAGPVERTPAPAPVIPENNEIPARPLAKPVSPRSTRPRVNPVDAEPAGQNPPEAEPPHSLPVTAHAHVSQPGIVQRSQAMPAETEKPARFETYPPPEMNGRAGAEAAKPEETRPARRIETPLERPPARSTSRSAPEADLPTILHPKPAASPRQPGGKPELSFSQATRQAVQTFIQRETEPAEPGASPPMEQAAAAPVASRPGPEATPASEAKGKAEDSAKALDEMTRQVYEILQRRLRVEFERSHGSKI